MKRIEKKDLARTIKKAERAAHSDGREICGLLIDNGHFLEILETSNISQEGGHFQFDAKQIRRIKKAVTEIHHEIVGTFHSHPLAGAKPGSGDINGTVDDSLMLIIDCLHSDAQLWRIKNGKARRLTVQTIEV
jgi:proteasome lid subunit RPN8/RPN11